MTRPSILIIDDDPASIQVLYRALEGLANVRFATSGRDGLGLMADAPADLVLLDARMPGLDGFETCRELVRDHPEVPVIFITAAADTSHELRALEVGAVDFISKPINPPVVRARVGVHLTLKDQKDRLQEREARIRAALAENEQLVAQLREALDQVKTLSEFLPMCMYCKRIRDDQGYWDRLETYIMQHSDSKISHSLCPDCLVQYCRAEGLEIDLDDLPPGSAAT